MRYLVSGGLIAIAVAGFLALAGCGKEPDRAGASKPAASEPTAKPYPHKTCVVSGEELGKMGEPKRIVYEGQEIKFCCPDCEKDFRKEPAKHLKKIEDARKGS
jgi:YHS domain-containing protein